MPTDIGIVHAYRHLYKGLLRAVMYSNPARRIVRDELRTAFREKGAAFDPVVVKRTIWFIQAAGRETGMEHKILKNMIRVRMTKHLHVRNWSYTRASKNQSSPVAPEMKRAYDHYDMTVAMLNKSLHLCLR